MKQFCSSGLFIIITYGIWNITYYFIILSIITYWFSSPDLTLDMIHHLFIHYGIDWIHLGPFFYLYFFSKLDPKFSWKPFLHFKKIKNHYLLGFLQGILIAGTTIIICLQNHDYHYLGWSTPWEISIFKLETIALRWVTLTLWVYFEEWLFRVKLKKLFHFKKFHHFILALSYALLKILQWNLPFSLGYSFWSLYLISLLLSFHSQRKTFYYSAGLFTGLLVLFQPVCGLTLFNYPFSGLLMFQNPIDQAADPMQTKVFLSIILIHLLCYATWNFLAYLKKKNHLLSWISLKKIKPTKGF